MAGEQSFGFQQSIENAEQAIRDGEPQRLVDVSVPFPLLITAEGYLDKYGPQEKYNLEPMVSELSLPTDFIFGGHELQYSGIAFAGLDNSIKSIVAEAGLQNQISLQVIDQADHMYSQHSGELAELVISLIGPYLAR